MNLKIGTALLASIAMSFAIGCSSGEKENAPSGGTSGSAATGDTPSFSLAWSEYPSWSIFGVADAMGIIDGDEGALGEIEEKYNVDIVLKEATYDSCLNTFTSGNYDAVCITNMDALIISPNRDGVAILPTSTSKGADACIVVGVEDIEALKQHEVYGLKGTVSQYCFSRCLEKAGFNPVDFKFTNQDPGVASVAMQQKQDSHKAIMVWNPFVLQTLNQREDSKVLFDSSEIEGEIVDMVVVGRDVLEKPGADNFAKAIVETFYRMNEELAKPGSGDDVLQELGEKFSNLGLEDMKKVVVQTQFYKSPKEALELLEGDAFKGTMKTVEKFCVDEKLVEKPNYGFGSESGKQLLFNPEFIKAVESK